MLNCLAAREARMLVRIQMVKVTERCCSWASAVRTQLARAQAHHGGACAGNRVYVRFARCSVESMQMGRRGSACADADGITRTVRIRPGSWWGLWSDFVVQVGPVLTLQGLAVVYRMLRLSHGRL